MGALRFSVRDTVNIRFAISPLGEALSAFRAAADPGGHAVHLPWLKNAAPLHREPEFAPLRATLSTAFRTPPPRCPLAEFGEELALLPAPAALADALREWWRVALEPHWPRIREVLEADVAHRVRQLAEDGFRQVFADLHPTLRWEHDRFVSPDLPSPDADLADGGITLAPAAFATRVRLLPGDGTTQPALVYPARAVGTLWERHETVADGLAKLLGRSRALLLAATSRPATTTQLAARSGLSVGAVSQHLAVLRATGLVSSQRYRREVDYAATELGLALLRGA